MRRKAPEQVSNLEGIGTHWASIGSAFKLTFLTVQKYSIKINRPWSYGRRGERRGQGRITTTPESQSFGYGIVRPA